MMFAPRGMAPGFSGAVPFGAHGMNAGPPGVAKSAPPPPGTVDIPVPVVELPDTSPMNVFVGKLPPDLHDSYIRQLLEVRNMRLFVCVSGIALRLLSMSS